MAHLILTLIFKCKTVGLLTACNIYITFNNTIIKYIKYIYYNTLDDDSHV